MSIDTAIPMEPVKEKLRNLPQYMPEVDETVYKFGEFLADRLRPRLDSIGFSVSAELALCDLQTGIDRYSNQPIRTRLAGCQPMIYGFLRTKVSDIAEAVCPEDFARGVREFQEQVNEKMRKQ